MFRNLAAGMSAREKRLLALMGLAAGVFGIFLVVFYVRSSITDLETEVDSHQQTLRQLELRGPGYLERLREKGRSRTPTGEPLPLQSLVESTSDKVGVDDPDTKALPDQRHEGNWIEHSMELSLRRVGLEQLTRFMETVESNRRRFPVAINKLEVRKRRRSTDEYDVKMTISTYEKTAPPREDATAAGEVAAGRGGR